MAEISKREKQKAEWLSQALAEKERSQLQKQLREILRKDPGERSSEQLAMLEAHNGLVEEVIDFTCFQVSVYWSDSLIIQHLNSALIPLAKAKSLGKSCAMQNKNVAHSKHCMPLNVPNLVYQ